MVLGYTSLDASVEWGQRLLGGLPPEARHRALGRLHVVVNKVEDFHLIQQDDNEAAVVERTRRRLAACGLEVPASQVILRHSFRNAPQDAMSVAHSTQCPVVQMACRT